MTEPVTDPSAEHRAEVRWQRAPGERFTDRRYGRAHVWAFDGGAEVPAAASPHAVPAPYTRPEHVDPEEALVAAASSCHMLTFLFLAARDGYVVDRYADRAAGEQGADAGGRAALTRVVLRPEVSFSGAKVPDDAAVAALHRRAHADCVVANSLRAPVECAGTWTHVAALSTPAGDA